MKSKQDIHKITPKYIIIQLKSKDKEKNLESERIYIHYLEGNSYLVDHWLLIRDHGGYKIVK